jgi:hypothetical protein
LTPTSWYCKISADACRMKNILYQVHVSLIISTHYYIYLNTNLFFFLIMMVNKNKICTVNLFLFLFLWDGSNSTTLELRIIWHQTLQQRPRMCFIWEWISVFFYWSNWWESMWLACFEEHACRLNFVDLYT